MVRRKFIIGSEWCYFKIYTGPKTVESILINIYPKICSLLSKKYIDSFFFIRYTDSNYHIRLRLHCADSQYLNDVLKMMSKTLQGYVNHLIIQKVQMDIYNRELERYGCNTIELSESFFYRDSVFILKYLRKVNSIDSDRWKISLRFINTLLNCNNYSLDDKIKFTEINANSYYNEFYRDNNESWKILNSKYRLKRNEIGIILNDKTSKVFKELDTFIFKYHFTNRRIFKEDFIVSVIHMHVNRMFRTRQRIVELVLYHFLHKYLLSEKAQIKYLEKVTVKNLIIRTPNNK